MQAQTGTGGYRGQVGTAARLGLWTLAWAATLALAKFGPEHLWDPQHTMASWVAIVVNLVVGIGWIVAFARLLAAMDELQRRILQDAMTVTLGVGWVGGFAYVAAESAGLVPSGVNVAVFPALLGVVYLVAFAVGQLRYR